MSKTKETARLKKKSLPLMDQSDLDYVSRATYQIGEVLMKIMEDKRFTNNDIADIFSEYIATDSTVSRIINHTAKRRISADLLFALRRMFGISLDALADDDTHHKSEFPPDLRRQLLEWAVTQMQGESGK